MNAMKIAAPALLLGLALTASPALAQQSSKGDRFGRPADRTPCADLRAGSHQVDVRAEGYDALHFDTRIEKGRTTFHRGTLSPATISFGK